MSNRSVLALAALAALMFIAGVLWRFAQMGPVHPVPINEAPLSEAPRVTQQMANVAFGSSGRSSYDEPMQKLEPVVDGEQLVVRSATLPGISASIPLPEWIAPDALQDALDMVTPQGLFERTGDWWSQEDFLALTGDDLARLLPDVEGYAFGGDGTLLDFVGALPLPEDCERGFADEEVQRALAAVAILEIPINALGMTPFDERTPEWQRDFDALVVAMRTRELDLARELERATGYAHWSILQRAFAAWNQ